MDIKSIITNLSNKHYTKKNLLDSSRHLLFIVNELNFSDNDKCSLIPQDNKHLLQQNNLYVTAESLVNDVLSAKVQSFINTPNKLNTNYELKKLPKDCEIHLGYNWLDILRSTYVSHYPFCKVNGKMLKDDQIKEIIAPVLSHLFDTAKKIPFEKMPNSNFIFSNMSFGVNGYVSFHQAMIALATHNFSHLFTEEFTELLNRTIPDGSINSLSFASFCSNFIFSQKQEKLMACIRQKFDPEVYNLACVLNTKNNFNFYYGLKNIISQTSPFEKFDVKDKEQILNSIKISLKNLGMKNNANYLKLFNDIDKKNLVNFIEENYNVSNFLFEMISSIRTHFDFPALFKKNQFNDVKILTNIYQRNMEISDKEFLYSCFIDFNDFCSTNLAQSIEFISTNLKQDYANFLAERISKEKIKELMSLNTNMFLLLNKKHREIKLQEKVDSSDKMEVKTRPVKI